QRGMELRIPMPLVILHRAVRVDHAAEVESDHAGQTAEERDAHQHIERELELRLSYVIAVAEQPGVAPAEPAQVVEAGEEEIAPEPAALRGAEGRSQEEPAAPDDLEGLDRVFLEPGVEAVVAAGGDDAQAELEQERGPPDRASGAVAGRIPAVGDANLRLRIEPLDGPQLVGGDVGGGEAEAVVR